MCSSWLSSYISKNQDAFPLASGVAGGAAMLFGRGASMFEVVESLEGVYAANVPDRAASMENGTVDPGVGGLILRKGVSEPRDLSEPGLFSRGFSVPRMLAGVTLLVSGSETLSSRPPFRFRPAPVRVAVKSGWRM
jgi:hypothetical protein